MTATLLAFPPYFRRADLPPILFTTSTRDDRVSPDYARKMAVLMQQQGHENIMLYEQTAVGLGGGVENQNIAFYESLVNEFIREMLADV